MNVNRAFIMRRALVSLLFLVLPRIVLCQEKFEPIPQRLASQYHIDFARKFFASPEVERADRAKLHAALTDLESLKGKTISSADNLQRALELTDAVKVQFYRHYAYLYLRHAVNTQDEASLADSSALDAEVSSDTAFFRNELLEIDDSTLAAFVAQRPSLKTYLFAIDSVRRYRPYSLTLKEEELLSLTAPLNSAWQSELYDKLRERPQSNTVNASGPQRRAERFKQYYAALAAQRDLYAFTLVRLAAARDRLARLRHFADAPSEAYFDSYWSRAQVDDLLERVASNADLNKRYQRLCVDHVKRFTGYNDINLWNMTERPPGLHLPRYTITQASQIIRAALAPLGPDYGRELAALLDPANGRMDIVPGGHRNPGGFSKGFIGTDSVFYCGGFTGHYNDVRVLAHESTHAVHRQLMNSNRVLAPYAEGPHYLFEAFAIFSEFLLSDYLYGKESDPIRKQYYLEQFFEGKGMEMFEVAPEVLVEHAVYDRVRQGVVTGPDDLDALTRRIFSRFSIWPEKHDELKAQWMNIELMFDDPFYDINYVYGILLALKFYEMYKHDPREFAAHYVALMRNGFDAPPDRLLKRFLDIDLNDPRLVSDDVKVLEEKVNLLEQNYQR